MSPAAYVGCFFLVAAGCSKPAATATTTTMPAVDPAVAGLREQLASMESRLSTAEQELQRIKKSRAVPAKASKPKPAGKPRGPAPPNHHEIAARIARRMNPASQVECLAILNRFGRGEYEPEDIDRFDELTNGRCSDVARDAKAQAFQDLHPALAQWVSKEMGDSALGPVAVSAWRDHGILMTLGLIARNNQVLPWRLVELENALGPHPVFERASLKNETNAAFIESLAGVLEQADDRTPTTPTNAMDR